MVAGESCSSVAVHWHGKPFFKPDGHLSFKLKASSKAMDSNSHIIGLYN